MSELRLFSIYDNEAKAYLRPFWSDYKVNAQRSFRGLVNQKDDRDNMVANHPDQFTLFEMGVFNVRTGDFVPNIPPNSLGNGLEYKEAV